jgi:hypothetical protein
MGEVKKNVTLSGLLKLLAEVVKNDLARSHPSSSSNPGAIAPTYPSLQNPHYGRRAKKDTWVKSDNLSAGNREIWQI